jgi:hypothetical protein
VYRSSKDTRNHFLWQPTLASLRNVEEDEAGRLRAFRSRFGRGWDLEGLEEPKEEGDGATASAATDGEAKAEEDDGEESLMDLISGGAYSKSYQDAKEALKQEALNRSLKNRGKKSKGGK